MELSALKNEVATAVAESGEIEFKSLFNPRERRDWVETIKDVVAIHNSGGGVIVFGLHSDGTCAGVQSGITDVVDPAHVIDKVQKYTGRTLHGLKFERFEKSDSLYDGWVIPPAVVPVPFKEPGTWEKPDRKQCTAFSRGQLYFRHGAKSECASYDDLASWKEKIIANARHEMYEEMGNLVNVPKGHTLAFVPSDSTVTVADTEERFRLTDDPEAPGCVIFDRYNTHPHRQKELLKRLAIRLPNRPLNQYDVLCIRRVFAPEIETMGLVYHPRHSSPHYAEGLVEWIAGKIQKDPGFVENTRAKYRGQFASSNVN